MSRKTHRIGAVELLLQKIGKNPIARELLGDELIDGALKQGVPECAVSYLDIQSVAKVTLGDRSCEKFLLGMRRRMGLGEFGTIGDASEESSATGIERKKKKKRSRI